MAESNPNPLIAKGVTNGDYDDRRWQIGVVFLGCGRALCIDDDGRTARIVNARPQHITKPRAVVVDDWSVEGS